LGVLCFVALSTALGVGRSRGAAATAVEPAARQELDDLYGIFRDEMRDIQAGNVYGGMGNRFQLDGLAYNHVFLALNAYDRLRATAAAPAFTGQEASVRRQLEAAQTAFRGVIDNLAWPRYRVDLKADAVDLAGPPRLETWAGVAQPVLLTLRNDTARAQSVALSAEGLVAAATLEVPPGASRHLLGTVRRDQSGSSSVRLSVKGGPAQLERTLPVHAAPTALLEGKLVDESGQPTGARVRVTTASGRYVPPEAHTYGLILKMFGPDRDQVAHRWFYTDGSFRLRAPLGAVRVEMRKGMEFKSVDTRVDLAGAGTTQKTFTLARWIDMPKRGWHAADVHLHFFDPPSAKFEMAIEDVKVVNVLVMNQLGAITDRERFTGALDSISDPTHLVYYNEEFRNGRLGHLALLNLKRLVEPISTGRLGAPEPQFFRSAHFSLLDSSRGRNGDAASPDRLLIEAMRETHRQGGLVNWAHLRQELEFPLDAALGEIDTVDILTDTMMPETLEFWYAMLNCGFRLPATGGTDRAAPHIPIGHQRVYTRLSAPFTYQQWIDAIRKGASFVTNAPMLGLTVDVLEPGDERVLSAPGKLPVTAWAESQLPFRTLDLVVNGNVVRSVEPDSGGKRARLTFDVPVDGPAWIAARAMGERHPEIMYYPHPEWSHPVVAHTSPVWVKYKAERLRVPASASFLLERLRKLEAWARDEAYFGDERKRQEALETIGRGMAVYRELGGR
jgi:hypothetical protein